MHKFGYNIFTIGLLTLREIADMIESYCWELNPDKNKLSDEEQIEAIKMLEDERDYEKINGSKK